MVKREYISNDKLNVDLYIGGHIHDSEITNLQNTRHTLTTLVAGIGWQMMKMRAITNMNTIMHGILVIWTLIQWMCM